MSAPTDKLHSCTTTCRRLRPSPYGLYSCGTTVGTEYPVWLFFRRYPVVTGQSVGGDCDDGGAGIDGNSGHGRHGCGGGGGGPAGGGRGSPSRSGVPAGVRRRTPATQRHTVRPRESIHCHGRSGLGPALLLAGSATASLSEALLTLVCAQNVCWGSFTCRLAPSTTSGLRSRTSGSTTARVFFSITEEKRPVTSSCQRVYRTFSPTASVPSRSTICWQRRRSLCGLRSCTATLETGSPG